jgi:hypothetical protein
MWNLQRSNEGKPGRPAYKWSHSREHLAELCQVLAQNR